MGGGAGSQDPARHRDWHLRRARRRSKFHRVLLQSWIELCERQSLPSSYRPVVGGTGGTRQGGGRGGKGPIERAEWLWITSEFGSNRMRRGFPRWRRKAATAGDASPRNYLHLPGRP